MKMVGKCFNRKWENGSHFVLDVHGPADHKERERERQGQKEREKERVKERVREKERDN